MWRRIRDVSLRLRKKSPGYFSGKEVTPKTVDSGERSSETVALHHPVMPVTDGFG